MFTPEAKAGLVMVVGGAFAGVTGGMNGGIRYALARKYWGRGIASRALGEMLNRMFADPALDVVTACVWHGNSASEKGLAKNGFCWGEECEDYGKARGERLKNNRFRLSRADWRALWA